MPMPARILRSVRRSLALATLFGLPALAWAGAQIYEPLSASVQSAMSLAIGDRAPVSLRFDDPRQGYRWLLDMSARLETRVPDVQTRVELLKTIQYEATRAGLDPQLVLGLIQVESNFRKYAVSTAGARGLMQVMPFWVELIGDVKRNDLFHLRTNLRFGCTILRYYLNIEHGNMSRALGRYNGSLGRAEYPNAVLAAARQWQFPAAAPKPATQQAAAGTVGNRARVAAATLR
jgi:soluble lytic murein transglycosylase-like protein